MDEHLMIHRLGARADGIADTADGPVYVPYALPGEAVRAARDPSGSRASLVAVETPSPDRIEAFCPYFGACGGCLTQHMAPAAYADWKRNIVAQALARAGFDAPVEPLADAHGLGRRRVTFHVRSRVGRRGSASWRRAATSSSRLPFARSPNRV